MGYDWSICEDEFNHVAEWMFRWKVVAQTRVDDADWFFMR